MEWLLIVMFPAVMYAFYGQEIIEYFKLINEEIKDVIDYIFN